MAVALFDVDHTLMRRSTGGLALRYYIHRGKISLSLLVWALIYGVLHFLDMVDESKMMQKALDPFVGDPVDRVYEEMLEVFNLSGRAEIFTDALKMVELHRRAGDRIILATASSKYLTGALAEYLGVELVASSAVETDGRLTAQLVRPLPYGPGKLQAVINYLGPDAGLLDEAYFYSDSHSDVPLLAAVGKPRVVNPDWRLRRLARQKNWPILHFREVVGKTAKQNERERVCHTSS